MSEVTNPKLLLLDGDGVCINFSAGFAQYMVDVHGHEAAVAEPMHFNYSDMYPTLEKPSAFIPGFIHSEHFEATPFYPEAVEKLRDIRANGTQIIMITSCGDELNVQRARRAGIEREVGDIIEDVIFLPLAGGKLDVLKKFEPATFVDDQLHMCIDGVQAGHQSFLFNRRYNQNVPLVDLFTHQIYRAYGWDCLPHIGHNNGPRTQLERHALAILTHLQHEYASEPLTDAQKAQIFMDTLKESPFSIPLKAAHSLLTYVRDPASAPFKPLSSYVENQAVNMPYSPLSVEDIQRYASRKPR